MWNYQAVGGKVRRRGRGFSEIAARPVVEIETTSRSELLEILPMESPHHFLVVAESEDDRSRYSRTLLRKFSSVATTDAGVAGAMVLATQAGHFSGAVVNITGAGDALRLVSVLRSVNPRMPIIALCTVDRSVDAFAVGASRFLLNAEWLMVGTLMAEVIEIANYNEQRRWSTVSQPADADVAKRKAPAA